MTFPASTHSPGSRSLPRGVLFSFVLIAIAAVAGTLLQSARAADVQPAAPADMSQAPADTVAHSQRVLAYYFHTTQRCATCRKIEAYTAEAIQNGFPEELKTGRLVFQALNVDEPENRHFLKDYELFTKSVVLVGEESGKQVAWKNLPKVWELIGDKEKFVQYIQGETRAYLAGAKP